MNAIERVRYSRNCTNDTFPLPDPEDCLWYAITELAEMIDAQLRARQPEHLRNHARNDDPRREAGQCGYMLLSAWIQVKKDDLDDFESPLSESTVVNEITQTLAEIAFALEDHAAPSTLYFAIAAWRRMCILSGWDPDALIDETCTDFERKHCVTREVL